jgi:hypothetical protein
MKSKGFLHLTRRGFLGGGAKLALLASISPFQPARGQTAEGGAATERAERVYQTRVRAARFVRDRAAAASVSNGDDARYPKRWGSYTKGLPHNEFGEVDPAVYTTYLRAVEKGDHEELDRVPLGGYLKLADPQAALAIDLIGPDAAQVSNPPAPAIASAEQAGELVEMYWHALLRDVPFADYDSNPMVRQAAAELSAVSDFRGPKQGGAVTPATLFRGATAGGRRGPYISQFLVRDIPMTPLRVPQRIRTAVAGRDYMTTPGDWLNIQNGQLYGVNTFDDTPRYIRNGRDLGEYVHRDFTYQAGLCACLMLMKMSAPLDGAIPYQHSLTQGGFVTFGPSEILHLAVTVANLSLKPTWYQKWIVHRRVRPEELGGRLHFALAGRADAPLHRDILQSEAVKLVRQRTGTAFLPQAYPEGCPSHPSYPAGHAVIAGACVTMLKALFADSWVLPEAFVPSKDGLKLERYQGPPLTVGGELDKLAENISIGRDFAGLHWRSDGMAGMSLGEEFTIRFLQEMKLTSNDFFTGFSLTKFDGTQITI